jgi:hypothetical protein
MQYEAQILMLSIGLQWGVFSAGRQAVSKSLRNLAQTTTGRVRRGGATTDPCLAESNDHHLKVT